MIDESTREGLGVWFRAAGVVLVATALVALLTGFYSRKFNLETGPAQWLWIEGDASEREPVVFFAVRDFDVPPDPPFVRVRVSCATRWTLYLNGEEIGGGLGEPDPSLDVFDLSDRVRKGEKNRLIIALRSADGVGGLLASVDYAPLRENDVVTDENWRICRELDASILDAAIPCSEKPVMLGQPPFGRWNYPRSIEGQVFENDLPVVQPVGESRGNVARSEIRIIDGLAVESVRSLPATVFDFGDVEGRGLLQLPEPSKGLTVVEVRYANTRTEVAEPAANERIVFAPGESAVIDPVVRRFRYIAVLNEGVTASARLQEMAQKR